MRENKLLSDENAALRTQITADREACAKELKKEKRRKRWASIGTGTGVAIAAVALILLK